MSPIQAYIFLQIEVKLCIFSVKFVKNGNVHLKFKFCIEFNLFWPIQVIFLNIFTILWPKRRWDGHFVTAFAATNVIKNNLTAKSSQNANIDMFWTHKYGQKWISRMSFLLKWGKSKRISISRHPTWRQYWSKTPNSGFMLIFLHSARIRIFRLHSARIYLGIPT